MELKEKKIELVVREVKGKDNRVWPNFYYKLSNGVEVQVGTFQGQYTLNQVYQLHCLGNR